MSSTLITAALVFYVAATALYLYYFSMQTEAAEKAALALVCLGFAVHTALLISNYTSLGRFPVISLKESLCFFSWSLAGMYLMVRFKTRGGALGVFVAPLATLFFVASHLAAHKEPNLDGRFDTALFPVHILLAFMGYAAFAFACGGAVMYLLQERGLKNRHPGAFLKRLPSLEELDALNYRSLTLGFFMLSLGIFTGALWLHNVEGRFINWDPKVLASAVTWMLYAIILHTRLFIGWRGRRTAMLSLLGFACVLATFLGAGFVRNGFHSFF